MTCVWNSLIKAIKSEDFKLVMKKPNPSPLDLINFLKNNNKLCTNIKHNDKFLRSKEYKENLLTINNLSTDNLHLGYLCSACEPVFILISHLFKIQINHNFSINRNVIKICYYPSDYIRYSITLNSNDRHMWS